MSPLNAKDCTGPSDEIRLLINRVAYLTHENKRLKDDLSRKRTALNAVQKNIWQGIAEIYNEKDFYHFNHSRRVSVLTETIVEKCLSEYSDEIIDELYTVENKSKAAGLLGYFHDIGKIRIGNELLFSEPLLRVFYSEVPGFLDYINLHADWGARYFEEFLSNDVDSIFSPQHREIIKNHHTKGTLLLKTWNNHFLRTTRGIIDLIYLESLRIADSYDAMTSNRVYKNKSLAPSEAIDDIIDKMIFNDIDAIDGSINREYRTDEELFARCRELIDERTMSRGIFYLGGLFSQEELRRHVCSDETQKKMMEFPCHRSRKAAQLHTIMTELKSPGPDIERKITNLLTEHQKINIAFMSIFTQPDRAAKVI